MKAGAKSKLIKDGEIAGPLVEAVIHQLAPTTFLTVKLAFKVGKPGSGKNSVSV